MIRGLVMGVPTLFSRFDRIVGIKHGWTGQEWGPMTETRPDRFATILWCFFPKFACCSSRELRTAECLNLGVTAASCSVEIRNKRARAWSAPVQALSSVKPHK